MITFFNRNLNQFILAIVSALVLGALFITNQNLNPAAAQERSNFAGGIEEDSRAVAAAPKAVRNDVAQPGEEYQRVTP